MKDSILAKASGLRRNSKAAELRLWSCLRGHRLQGLKFKRQMPIGRYIVDFVCIQHQLIIELDGGHHMLNKQYHEQRTLFLNTRGYRVCRFWNDDVLLKTEAVLEDIMRCLFLPPSPQPSPGGRGGYRWMG